MEFMAQRKGSKAKPPVKKYNVLIFRIASLKKLIYK
jgi:hypothetical protein